MQFSMPYGQEMQSLIDFCKVMSTCPAYQKLGPGGVLAIYLTAKENNLPFMGCLNGGLHFYDGKITYSGILIAALIRQKGHDFTVIHSDDKSCKIKFIRGDKKNDPNYQPFIFEYTVEEAQIAGYLSKNNWKTSRKPMLYNRCITGGGRMHFSELFVGVLVAGELVGTNSDQDAIPCYSESQDILIEDNSVDQLKEISLEQPNEISLEMHPEWDNFLIENELIECKLVEKYVEEIVVSHKKPMNFVKVTHLAIENKDKFLEGFKKWSKNKIKKNDENKQT